MEAEVLEGTSFPSAAVLQGQGDLYSGSGCFICLEKKKNYAANILSAVKNLMPRAKQIAY